MSRKLVLIMTLMVFLVGMLSVAFKVKMVKASGTIYIDIYGNVVNTDKIQRNGTLYTFTANINDSIIVQKSNIIIDGKGYTLQGSGIGRGFMLYGINNVTVKNTKIKDFGYGVDLESSNNSIVSGNTITNSTEGVYVVLSNNSAVSGNIITNSNFGVSLESSNNDVVSGNTITNSTNTVVYLQSSNSSIVSGNTITNTISYGIRLVSSNGSVVSGNTVTNSTYTGVCLESSNSIVVSGNTITINQYGVYLGSSNGSVVSGNIITNTTITGVYLRSSNSIVVSGNTITNNTAYGVYLYSSSNNNKIYHNNFINNPQQASASSDSLNNVWDDGYPSGGNYWSNYAGVDANMDGIGDTFHQINSIITDHYPLKGRFSDFPATLAYHVTTVCNSTISVFEFDQANRIISFNVTGGAGIGFCRVCIPHALMKPPYTITIDGHAPQYVNYTLYDNGTHRWIYFTYQHSTHEVEIIPEFPTWTSMLLLFTVLTVAIATYKRKLLKTPTH
jgi:parallel beta-helix repeat protein